MAERSRVEKSVDFKLANSTLDEADKSLSTKPQDATIHEGGNDLAELKARFDPSVTRAEQAAPEAALNDDADLEVEGLGKFYDRIPLDGTRRSSQPQPKSILKNRPPRFP